MNGLGKTIKWQSRAYAPKNPVRNCKPQTARRDRLVIVCNDATRKSIA